MQQQRFNNSTSSQAITVDKSIEILLTKKSANLQKITAPHKHLLQAHESQVITVPIKEYSNKFLRQKKKQELQNHPKKKESFPNNHLQNNRKLICEFKKIKGRSLNFRNSFNKQNGDFIIHNLLFQKNQSTLLPTSNPIHKTIFGSFADNCLTPPIPPICEESCLFEKGWKTVKNENPFQTKKQVYDKICQKQKSLIPEYRKKSKTFGDISNIQNRDTKDKKVEKISTSRALQKYSKIIKVNPEHGKIEKMKIKKQLAKSLRFQNSQKGDFQTKQIVLSRKQTPHKRKNNLTVLQQANRNYSIDNASKLDDKDHYHLKTPQKDKFMDSKENLCAGKVGMFTANKVKRLRKFSHQVQSNKKCLTEQKMFNYNQELCEDFQINGWDINF